MKKIMTVLTAFVLGCAPLVSQVYLNATVPLQVFIHSQKDCHSENSAGDSSINGVGIGITGEVFAVLQDDFGIGVKGGYMNCDNASADFKDISGSFSGRLNSWSVAPSMGWANDRNAPKRR